MPATRPPRLLGRTGERELLDRLLADVRGGESAVLVIRGEAGIGKTALLQYTARQASGFRLAPIAGVEAEMELPFAGVHQLCALMFARLDALPKPQRDALGVALGMSDGEAPDRFLVGLAVLSLLSGEAEERPLLCLVDDAQWLDQASALTLAFVARRLRAESVGIVFALREPDTGRDLVGLPELPWSRPELTRPGSVGVATDAPRVSLREHSMNHPTEQRGSDGRTRRRDSSSPGCGEADRLGPCTRRGARSRGFRPRRPAAGICLSGRRARP
jgi:hypothetical protein